MYTSRYLITCCWLQWGHCSDIDRFQAWLTAILSSLILMVTRAAVFGHPTVVRMNIAGTSRYIDDASLIFGFRIVGD